MVITTHRYVHRFLLEIWNELVYEGRKTHIQTMIHKRQLKTRRFLVLSGFYVLMYMNLDEKRVILLREQENVFYIRKRLCQR